MTATAKKTSTRKTPVSAAKKMQGLAAKAAAKATTVTDKRYADVRDEQTATSAELTYALMEADASYALRVSVLAPVLAKRVHDGESQADIARGLVEVAKGKGSTLSLAAAKMRVSRYVRIGDALIRDPKADAATVIAKKSAEVRKGTEGKKRGAGKKTAAEKATTDRQAVAATSQNVAATLRRLEASMEAGADTVADDADLLVKSLEGALKKAAAIRDLATKNAKAKAAATA